MVTCGPIVFSKVLWMQHLQIIFDFNALDMVQIFKSMLMVIKWYKTEIAQYFCKRCFFYIYYQREIMNRKGILWVKASEGTTKPCGFTRHPQNGMGEITIKVLWYDIKFREDFDDNLANSSLQLEEISMNIFFCKFSFIVQRFFTFLLRLLYVLSKWMLNSFFLLYVEYFYTKWVCSHSDGGWHWLLNHWPLGELAMVPKL